MKLFEKFRKQAHVEAPFLTVILMVYDMPEQALRTLGSLSADYQFDVKPDEYEILVVENLSENNLSAQEVASVAQNARYIARNEPRSSPVFAINSAAKEARGSHLAIIIDGARLLTPRVIRNTLNAMTLSPDAVVAVHGYHLGEEPQQYAVLNGYDETKEKALLSSINWPDDGYRLFDIACLSESSRANGILENIPESNYLALSQRLFLKLVGYEEQFDGHGGGYANLDFFKRTCEHKESVLYNLVFEGTFHQYHGGATTGGGNADRAALMGALSDEYRKIRGTDFKPPQEPFTILGRYERHSSRFLIDSLRRNVDC